MFSECDLRGDEGGDERWRGGEENMMYNYGMFLVFLIFIPLMIGLYLDGNVTLSLEHENFLWSMHQSYVKTVMIVAAVICVYVILCKLYRILIKSLFFLIGRSNKQYKAVNYYMNYKYDGKSIDGFKRVQKYFQDNLFYWVLALEVNDKDLQEQARVVLSRFGVIPIEIERLMEQKKYNKALDQLMLLSVNKQVRERKFECYIALKMFDNARKLGCDVKRVVLAEIACNVNVLMNYEWLYKNCGQVKQYVEKLLECQEYDRAVEVIKLHYQDLEIGKLLLKAYPNASPAERFAQISKITVNNNDTGRFLQAQAAIDARFYDVANQLLIELGKTSPALAFPLLGKLAMLEEDVDTAVVWFEKALFG